MVEWAMVHVVSDLFHTHHGAIVCTSFSLSTDCFWIELRIKKAVVFMHAGFHLLDVSDSLKTARLGWWIEALRLFNGCLSGAAPFSWGEVSMATSGYHTTSQPSSVEDILCVSLFVGWSSEGGKTCLWMISQS